jgi:hypothetical protein
MSTYLTTRHGGLNGAAFGAAGATAQIPPGRPVPALGGDRPAATSGVPSVDVPLDRAVRQSGHLRRGFYLVVLLVALAGQVSGAVASLHIPPLWDTDGQRTTTGTRRPAPGVAGSSGTDRRTRSPGDTGTGRGPHTTQTGFRVADGADVAAPADATAHSLVPPYAWGVLAAEPPVDGEPEPTGR